MKAEDLRDLLEGCDGLEVVFSVPEPGAMNRGHRHTNRRFLELDADMGAEGGGLYPPCDDDSGEVVLFVPTEQRAEDAEPTHLCLFLRRAS